MPNVDLNIVLKLLDEASDQIKKTLGETKDDTKKVEKETEKSANAMTKSWTTVSLKVASVIGAFALARKAIQELIETGKQIDPEFKKSFQNFEVSVFRAKAAIAEQIIPALETALDFWTEFLNTKFSGSSEGLREYNKELERSSSRLEEARNRQNFLNTAMKNAQSRGDTKSAKKFKNDIAELQKIIDLENTRVGVLKKQVEKEKELVKAKSDENVQLLEAKNYLSSFAAQQDENNTLYMAGKMASDEYYSAIMSNEYETQMLRQQSMAQMQELATLEMQISNNSFMEAQRLTQERISLLNFYKETYNTAHAGMAAFTVMLGQTIQTQLSTAIMSMILNVHNAKDAFKQLEKAMIQAILNFMIQKMVAFVLEKTLLAGHVAASTLAGSAIAKAWAPAAAMVSLASWGANSIPAAAGIATVTAMAAIAAGSSKGSSGFSEIGGAFGDMAVSGAATTGGAMVGGPIGAVAGAQYGGAQADGGDYIVHRPTLFLAGDNGDERATFTPMGRSSSGRSERSVYIDINIDRPVVSRESDIDYLVEEVSRRVSMEVERIR